ncbi:MAG: hypothetical protein K9I25_07420 [Crocinitomicaceae bacterium]|jgi:hypothetical protein|nr:hypothetical protein [Crocinitomicaceae bacterium]
MKFLFAIVLALLSFVGFGQYNLQLNQVVLVSNTLQTVPAGKVWKVESYMQAGIAAPDMIEVGGSCAYSDRHHPMIVNGQTYFLINGSPGHGSSGTFLAASNILPMWLPAGATLRTACAKDVLSVIEFNLVP